jgi:hypothetical protein
MTATSDPISDHPGDDPGDAGDMATDHRLGPVFWVALLIGGAIMAFGVRGVLADLGTDNPAKLATWVVGLDLVHDLVAAPAIVIIGLVLARLLPAPARGPVCAAAALSVVVVLFSIPLITAWGRRAGNSSTLPLNYAHNVAIIVTGIWIVAAATIVIRVIRGRSSIARTGPSAAP